MGVFSRRRDPHGDFPDWEFSQNALAVMHAAVAEARRIHHEYLSSCHLVLGMLSVEDSFAAQILADLGLCLADVRHMFEKANPQGPKMLTEPRLARTPEHRRVVKRSIYDAHDLGHTTIRSEHLLLAVGREPCDAADWLRHGGLSQKRLVSYVMNAVNVPPSS